MDRRILRTIIEKYSGGPVGLKTIAISVGEETDTLEDYYEPFLVQSGLLKRTPRGRMATSGAYQHLGISYPKLLDETAQDTLFDDNCDQ
jgi:holliday junction DNA helicase RuvB